MLSPKFHNRFAAAIASLVSATILLTASIGPGVNNSATLVI